MQIAMLWVYQAVKGPHGTRMEAGQKPSLCFRGREYMLCVAAAHPVRVFKRPVKDFDTLRRVTNGNGGGYPVEDAVTKLRAIAARNGITIGASRLLDRALNEAAEIKEEQFEDEEELTAMETVKTDDTNGTEAPPATEEGKTTETQTNQETADVASKKTKSAAKSSSGGSKGPKAKKAAKPAKAAKKAKPKGEAKKGAGGAQMVEIRKGAPKLREGSVAHKAYLFWCEQLGKQEDVKNLDRGVRKEIGDKINSKFSIKSGANYFQYFAKHFGLPKK